MGGAAAQTVAGRREHRTRQRVAAPGNRRAADAAPQPCLPPPPTPPPTRPTPADSDAPLRLGSAASSAVPSRSAPHPASPFPPRPPPAHRTRSRYSSSPGPASLAKTGAPFALTSSIFLVVLPFAIIDVAVGILEDTCPTHTHAHPPPPAPPPPLIKTQLPHAPTLQLKRLRRHRSRDSRRRLRPYRLARLQRGSAPSSTAPSRPPTPSRTC